MEFMNNNSGEFIDYDFLFFKSLEYVADHIYYNIQSNTLYPIVNYDKVGLPTILLPNGEVFELDEIEAKYSCVVENLASDLTYLNGLDNNTYEVPSYTYGSNPVNEKESKHCTQSEIDHAIKYAEEIIIDHAIDIALKDNDLKGDNT